MVKQRILVVDDDKGMLSIIETRLRHAGYEVTLASDGEEAMKCMKKKTPRLVFLDIVMPGMDGYEVLYRMKQNRKTRVIPVVMITSKRDDQDVKRAISLGARDYIVKPFSPTLLVEKAKKVLK